MEQDNELDKKRIVERFEKQIENLTEHFKEQVRDVRKDFENDLREIQKHRARDKSDNEVRLEQVDNSQTLQKNEHLVQKAYFKDMAQICSMLTETISMQMEAEHAELIDK